MEMTFHTPAASAPMWHSLLPLVVPSIIAVTTWIISRLWRRSVVRTALVTQVNNLEETLRAELEYIATPAGSDCTWFSALPFINSDIVTLSSNGDLSKTQAHYMTDLYFGYRAMLSRISEYARVVDTNAQIDTLLVINVRDDGDSYRDSIKTMLSKIDQARSFLESRLGSRGLKD